MNSKNDHISFSARQPTVFQVGQVIHALMYGVLILKVYPSKLIVRKEPLTNTFLNLRKGSRVLNKYTILGLINS